ncbi:MAG: MerR family transcriptional regulator, partial [Alphaproteobacteria bacterium]|nr:MerR family transcriptional regulator [Alphaproteobacteria bacterium]
YRPEDILLLRGISRLLYEDGFTIKGVQKLLKENGVRAVIDAVKEAPEEESLAPAVQGAANPADVVPFSGDHLPSEAKKVLRAALKDLEALKKDLTKPQ